MFDMWYGDIELTTLTLIISFVIILPIQLMFCFRVKNRAVRLLPVAILSSVTAILLVIALFVQGWDGLGYAIWASCTGFMLFMCGVGWGIWWITNRKKQSKYIK